MKIKIVMPFKVRFLDQITEDTARKYASRDTEITCVHIQKGPDSIEGEYDGAFAVPGVLEEVGKGEEEGYDGALISCFGDPGLEAAREAANIPIAGTAESTMLFAAGLAQRFSVVSILQNAVPRIENQARALGISQKLASIRDIDVCVASMKSARESEEGINRLYEQAKRCVETDGAHAIVLGATCMTAIAPKLYRMLREKDGYDIPVIDPVGVPVKFLESLVSLSLKQSKLTYMLPREKVRSV